MQKTFRDAQAPPTRSPTPKARCKPAKRPKEQPAEDSSSWDSEDERKTYGPDTRRSRRADYKKDRLCAEAAVLKRLIADSSGKKDKGDRSSVPSLEAVRSLAAAACASRGSSSSGSTVPGAASAVRETCTGQAEYAVSSAPASLRTRSRPYKETCHTSARATAAAVQALLRGKPLASGARPQEAAVNWDW